MKLTHERKPVNKQAAMQLSKGTDSIDTVEEALFEFSERINQPDFINYVRASLNSGANIRLSLVVKKSHQPGYIAQMNCVMESPKKPMGCFLRIT
jgi:hypothetical protein